MHPDDMTYSAGPWSISHPIGGGGAGMDYNPDLDLEDKVGKESKPVLGIAMRWQLFDSEINLTTLLRQAKNGLFTIAAEFSYMLDKLKNFKEYNNPLTRLNRLWATE
jgi:hypothetical protein